MDTLLHIGLSNAAAATVLALTAALLGRLCHRPALSHALWVLVLLKLITPPLVPLSIPWPAAAARTDGVKPDKQGSPSQFQLVKAGSGRRTEPAETLPGQTFQSSQRAYANSRRLPRKQ